MLALVGYMLRLRTMHVSKTGEWGSQAADTLSISHLQAETLCGYLRRQHYARRTIWQPYLREASSIPRRSRVDISRRPLGHLEF